MRRLLHGVLSAHPHRAWLFVDDLLAALHRPNAHQQFALIVIFFAAINAPISWKKVQFQNCLTWCGWSINFYRETRRRLFHASQVTHLAPGRTRFVDHGGI